MKADRPPPTGTCGRQQIHKLIFEMLNPEKVEVAAEADPEARTQL